MPATATQVKVHKFYAKGRLEKLVRQPEVVIPTAMGTLLKQQSSVSYSFAPNAHLEVYEGQDVLADGPLDPETLEPTRQDAVAWLTAHPLLNTRFWHDGYEPGRALPTEADFLAVCTQAVADLALEPVQAALAQELETHKRSLLVATAEDCIAHIQRKLDEYDAAQGQAPDEVA